MHYTRLVPAHGDRLPVDLADLVGPARALRSDLDSIAYQVQVALRHANQVLEMQLDSSHIDGHRDALHLLARIETLGDQVEHAAEVLRRIEDRDAGNGMTLHTSPNGTRSLPTSAVTR